MYVKLPKTPHPHKCWQANRECRTPPEVAINRTHTHGLQGRGKHKKAQSRKSTLVAQQESTTPETGKVEQKAAR